MRVSFNVDIFVKWLKSKIYFIFPSISRTMKECTDHFKKQPLTSTLQNSLKYLWWSLFCKIESFRFSDVFTENLSELICLNSHKIQGNFGEDHLTHFMSLVPFYTPWKHHKTQGVEKEMAQVELETSATTKRRSLSA